ncbi:hypothetical protein HY970_03490 [Candidatus Kaiserbacteria bacterium]|nr:hypothetical protein [Candidatus Kaiserbacteria bacterium]
MSAPQSAAARAQLHVVTPVLAESRTYQIGDVLVPSKLAPQLQRQLVYAHFNAKTQTATLLLATCAWLSYGNDFGQFEVAPGEKHVFALGAKRMDGGTYDATNTNMAIEVVSIDESGQMTVAQQLEVQ